MKTYSNTYLYRKYEEYDKKLFDFIMSSDRINPNSPEFEDIIYDIKRQNINDYILKAVKSDNIVLCVNNTGKSLPKAFKVFVAKDVRQDRKRKVFIDLSDCIALKNGKYATNNINWIISYLINAVTSYIYNIDERRLVNNSSIIIDGGTAFVKCFSYVIDRIYKISTIQSLRHKVEYCAGLYYQINILGKDMSANFTQIKVAAMKMINISKTDANVVDISLDENAFDDIDTFIKNIARIFNFNDLKLDSVIAMWMRAFGTGTVFGIEYFPAFAMMMSNTYVGGYIDQQTTIEKVTGDSMVSFVRALFKIGAMATCA